MTHIFLFHLENATIEDIKGFVSEITLMKSVVHHKHIVGIVGHSTKLFSKMMLLTEYCSEGNLLDYLRYWASQQVFFDRNCRYKALMIFCRKFRDMSTVDKFTLAETDIVTLQLPHEQSPEDIFNFDTKNIDKFTHKEKSILLSDIGQTNSKKLLIPIDTKTNNIHPHVMQNITFNKLYDESQILCNVPFDDGLPQDGRNENFALIDYKTNRKQDSHGQSAGE